MTWLSKTALMTVLFAVSAQASAHGRDYYSCKKNCSTSKEVSVSAPLNYHATYAAIQSTFVTIKDVTLRLADGKTVKVPGTEREIDLQDLSGFGKGIVISLNGVNFPEGAPTASVVEIQVPIVNENSARLVSSDNSTCKLHVPHSIVLYTSAPVTVIAGQDYRIGVDFTALDDIQLKSINTVTTKKCCEHKKNSWRSDKSEKVCETTSSTQSENKCKLANRRHLINKLVRPADEF
jgi:hypothetical protein